MSKRTKARGGRQAPSVSAKRASAKAASQQMSVRTRRIVFAVLAVVVALMMLIALLPGVVGAPSP